MPKSNPKALSFNRTLKLNSNSNQINGNIFVKKKTLNLRTPTVSYTHLTLPTIAGV